MTTATDLSPEIWNAIAAQMARAQTAREVKVGRVIKRDVAKRHIWLREFGEVAIPLVSFNLTAEYYDTRADGSVLKRTSSDGVNIVVPRVGTLVAVLDPLGNGRFPMCVGIIQSKPGYWQGE